MTGGSGAKKQPARGGSAVDRLFVYGTLQFVPVLEELLGRTPEYDFVVARDQRAAALPGRLYPGLVPQSGRMTAGLILKGLTRADWEVIDGFEDDEFELRAIPVLGEDEPVPTYVWTADATRNDWNPEVFATEHLSRYVERCARYREGQDPDEPGTADASESARRSNTARPEQTPRPGSAPESGSGSESESQSGAPSAGRSTSDTAPESRKASGSNRTSAASKTSESTASESAAAQTPSTSSESDSASGSQASS